MKSEYEIGPQLRQLKEESVTIVRLVVKENFPAGMTRVLTRLSLRIQEKPGSNLGQKANKNHWLFLSFLLFD
jgi:hypothetical protein